MPHPIPVFYMPQMVGKPSSTFSPSARKPQQVVADWLKWPDIAGGVELVEFDPISRDTIALAHDARYVADVLARRAENGFGERSRSVADSLPYTCGSMLAAALHVLQAREDWPAVCRIACSPSSGFHHAHHDHGRGYCTFNGLMVAALELKRRGQIETVLILDCDEHYGDGTQDIIRRHDAQWVRHVTHRGRLPGSYQAKEEMTALIAHHLPALAGTAALVLYQAGADCHVADPLGGFLTTEDMRQRDRLIFSLALKHKVPLVWNLAGGYQRDARGGISPVLTLHRNTVREALAACDRADRSGSSPN